MSIIEIDQRKFPRLYSKTRLTWQQKFRNNMYISNYNKYYKNENKDDIEY